MNTLRQLSGIFYSIFLTVTDVPQPITAEFGDDPDAVLINVVNPRIEMRTNAESDVDIFTGDRNGQYNRIASGGTGGLEAVTPPSRKYVRCDDGLTKRIQIDIYK